MNEVIELKGNLVITKSLIGQVEDLAAEHEAFNAKYVIGGRKALYSLLGKIAGLMEQFDLSVDKAELIKTMRKNLQEQYGIKTQENTSDIAVLVRYITRADRKTAYLYAKAIEIARSNQIAPAQLAGYLEKGGGIERICSEGAVYGLSEKDHRLGIAKMYLNARRIFPLTSFKLHPKSRVQISNPSDLSVLICSEAVGRQYVLASLPIDSALEKKVLTGLVQQLPDDIKDMSRKVAEFHEKAKSKQSQNTFKAIVKKRSALAEGMLRIKRIRNLAEVQ